MRDQEDNFNSVARKSWCRSGPFVVCSGGTRQCKSSLENLSSVPSLSLRSMSTHRLRLLAVRLFSTLLHPAKIPKAVVAQLPHHGVACTNTYPAEIFVVGKSAVLVPASTTTALPFPRRKIQARLPLCALHVSPTITRSL